ncbi:MAG: TrkA family potassium uptake protein [Anaerolineaceae bacterium]|jgi:trk system potassium uptake protein TrkA|nr:TrkA family potassium uptake protein [Anaerolineaceae bacterium]
MKVVIVGCGRLGAELAYRLFLQGNEVSIIDSVSSAFQSLPPDFNGLMVEGDVLNRDILARAGIQDADAVALVTSSDVLNLCAGHVVTEIYHVPNVVARNYDPHYRQLFEIFGMQVVSSTSWGAQRVEEMIYHSEVRTVFSAGNGEIEIYEVHVPQCWEGRQLSELLAPEGCRPVALTRAGRASMPSMETMLEGGDVVLVSATSDAIENMRKRGCFEEGA